MSGPDIVYQWLEKRGWRRVALELVRFKDSERGERWIAWAICGELPYDMRRFCLADVRGPVEGVMEEVVTLERKHPEWCAMMKPLVGSQ